VHLLQGSGAVLGILELANCVISQEQIGIQTGDRLVLYTDGLTDLLSGAGDQYDREQFISLLLKNSSQPLEQMCDEIFSFLHEFQAGAEPFDDMTLVILQVR